MGMAITLKEYLKDCHIVFEEIEHPCHPTSIGSATSARITGETMAKGVLLQDDFGYMVAVPPIGGAYGIRVIWDDSLSGQPEIYFEGGDHRTLVHISGGDFSRLMSEAGHDRFSAHI